MSRAEHSPSKRVLIVGAGIAGMQAAIDIASSGYEVVMVDRLPSIGGHMHQLSETYPTLDCAQCILTPRTVEVGHHENIKLHVYSEIEAIEGEVGDFRVRIRQKPAYVNWDLL
jgi:heterodisulfide reductase subunit A